MNDLGEKSRGTIILGQFVNKPWSNSHWFIVLENVFNWSNVKARSHDLFFSWTFDLLLINSSRYLVFRVYFSPCQRNIVCEWIQTSRETNHEIKANIFTCFWYWCWKNRFLNVKLNLFMNNFYKHFFRSSRLQMFFKINGLKNFTILRMKKRLQHRCFPVRSSHMVLTYW